MKRIAYIPLVWCWGWDGAGDLEGPDVDLIWERMPNKSLINLRDQRPSL